MDKKIVTRFSPSPTSVFKTNEDGYLVGGMHVGNLRNALYSYIFAKQNNGKFILRIEDTDQKRSNKESLNDILKTLTDFNLLWDEFYIQSERLELYKYYAYMLVQDGYAYICNCNNSEEICNCKTKQNQPIGEFCVKLNIKKFSSGNDDYILLKDGIRKDLISYPFSSLYDIVLLKSDGLPTYHLASVVDDHLMGVTHIFRSDEWIASYPYHVCLYNAFNWELPNFFHLPLLTSITGEKLSKRDGDLSVRALLRSGILPSTIINYISLLGWHPEGHREIYTLDELISKFDIKRFKTKACCYDEKKLKNMNLKHARTDYGKCEFFKYLSLNFKEDLYKERLYEIYMNGINIKELLNSLRSSNLNYILDENFKSKFNEYLNLNNSKLNKPLLTEEDIDNMLINLEDMGFSKKEINENIRYIITGKMVGLPAKTLLGLINFKRFYSMEWI